MVGISFADLMVGTEARKNIAHDRLNHLLVVAGGNPLPNVQFKVSRS